MEGPDGGAALPHLHDTGEGPPLLLLHAFPQDASMWDHQVAALSGRHRCLRPDAHGCGVSPPPPEGLRIDTWAERVLAALDAAGVGRVAVAGLSMGGYLAFALLRVAPERLAGLALLATRATADTDAVRADRGALAARLRAVGAPAVEELVESQPARLLGPVARGEYHIVDPVRGRIRRCSPEGLAALADLMADRPDSTPLLGSIGVPTLVLAGAEDGIAPVDEMRAMAAAIPGARFEAVAASGHLLCVERHAATSALLGEWLTTVRW